jgi:phospholipid/cholesterol/gamma-HCH transport system ATP-binding protein
MEKAIENKEIKIKNGEPGVPVGNALEIEHLKVSFGKLHVLKDMNLTLGNGENLIVLGKSGSGKSVLIKCLVGLITPDNGTITIKGEVTNDLTGAKLEQARRKIGFLFQSAALYDSMTIRENMEFPLRGLNAGTDKEIDALVKEALENVGLLQAIDKMPSELSGGMRKRIGLARTLILKPEIMLYDEPTTGLDPITSREISKLILDMQKKYNTSSIIITHDMECARITGNRILVIKEGLCAAQGTYEELKKSEDPWIRSFFE